MGNFLKKTQNQPRTKQKPQTIMGKTQEQVQLSLMCVLCILWHTDRRGGFNQPLELKYLTVFSLQAHRL